MRLGGGVVRSGLAMALPMLAATAAEAGPPPASKDCFAELARGRSPLLACEFPTRLTEAERADLKRLTRDMLLDASCVVSISIERRLVDAALSSPDHVFEAPPQPVKCEVTTAGAVYPITATFAPRVVFVGDVATEGSPRLADVQGVPAYLAWPVVQYVNRAPGIRSSMLEMINAYRTLHQFRGSAGVQK